MNLSINSTNTTQNNIQFSTNGTEYMRLTYAGNFGIRTPAPVCALDVSGAALFRTNVDMSANRINNVAVPAAGSDAANKAYVDASGASYTNLATTTVSDTYGNTHTGTAAGPSTGSATCISNTFVGMLAGTVDGSGGSYNVGMGYQALTANTSGARNTALGYGAAMAVTTGSGNVAVGAGSLAALTVGSDAVAVGRGALAALTSGSGNVAIGTTALTAATTAANNVGVGSGGVLGALVGGSGGNVGVGYAALSAASSAASNVGVGSGGVLAALTTGGANTALGYAAGSVLTTGGSNIYVGASTAAGGVGVSNEIVIGAGATGLGSGTTVLGNAGTTSTTLRGAAAIGPLYPGAGIQLDVSGTSAMVARFSSAAGVSDAQIAFNDNGAAGSAAYFQVGLSKPGSAVPSSYVWDASAGRPLRIGTGGSERVRIDGTTGYLGLGLGGSNASTMLQVNGRGAVGWGGGITQSDTTDALYLENAAGTKNATQLHLYYADPAGALNAYVALNKAGTAGVGFGGTDAALSVGTVSAHPVVVGTAGTERLRVDAAGRVAIGTAGGSVAGGGAYTVDISGGIKVRGVADVSGNRVINVATPVAQTDAVNRLYVDTLGSSYVSLATAAVSDASGNTRAGTSALSAAGGAGGGSNTALGYNALGALVSGSGANTALGYAAGSVLTTGGSNIYVGASTAAGGVGVSNEIVIGAGATGLGSGTTVLGNNSTTTTVVRGMYTGLGSGWGVGGLLPAYCIDASSSTSAVVARLGSGTGIADTQLVFRDGDGSGTSSLRVGATKGLGAAGAGTGATYIWDASGGRPMRFATNNLERMRIVDASAAGAFPYAYVGIGTAAPAYALDVSAGSTGTPLGMDASGAVIMRLRNNATSVNSLQIGASTRVGYDASAAMSFIWETGNASGFRIATSGAERLRIDPSGSVGIGLGGSVGPAYTLDVSGSLGLNASYLLGNAGTSVSLTNTVPGYGYAVLGNKLNTFQQTILTNDASYGVQSSWWGVWSSYSAGGNYPEAYLYTSQSQFAIGINSGLQRYVITATGLSNPSDERIKTNICVPGDDYYLRILDSSLCAVQYDLKGAACTTAVKGVFGFRAQDVAGVMPSAVRLESDYVDNLMLEGVRVRGKTATFTRGDHGIQINGVFLNKIRLVTSAAASAATAETQVYDYDFVVVDARTIQLLDRRGNHDNNDEIPDGDDYIADGQMVSDFHSLDKNQVFAMTYGAVKAVYNRMKTLEERIQAIEQRLQTL